MILSYKNFTPDVHPSVFIAPSADVIGQVKIGKNSGIWFQAVVRGDVNTIEIGEGTNIQDQSCLHVTRRRAPLKVGNFVTVGHRVTLHGCTIEDNVLIGMGAIIMDHAVIGERSIVAAGALVTEGKKMPPGHLILGSPAKAVRPLTEEELAFLPKSADNYIKDALDYENINSNKAK